MRIVISHSLIVLVAALGLTKPTFAQTATGAQLEFKVTEVPEHARLIHVSVNKGVLVDFNQPIKEVRIANPDIADVSATSPRQVLVNGRSFGTTQLIVWVDDDRQQVFDIAVDLDLKRLEASMLGAAPRANVRATSVLDSVVLTGTVPDAESAERILQIARIFSDKLVNHIRVAGVQQVLLRVTVAEVNRAATRQLGFNGWLAGDNFRDVFAVSQLDGINPVNIGGAADVNVAGTIPFLTDTNGLPLQPTPALSLGFPRLQMQIFIKALRENALLRVLAEPNLVTVSGERAEFLAGGEFPIPVPQGGLNSATTIEYREFGVRLNFTPAVLDGGLIRLNVAPEVSEPDFSTAVTLNGFVVPGLTQRRVETTVELGSGQSFAIGGLLSHRTRAISRSIPGLGEVPILGALFRSVDYQEDETELVVLVTPELVAPLSPDQITGIPGGGFVGPNDYELFIEGKLEGAASRGNALPPRTHRDWPARPSKKAGGPMTASLRGPFGPAGMSEGK